MIAASDMRMLLAGLVLLGLAWSADAWHDGDDEDDDHPVATSTSSTSTSTLPPCPTCAPCRDDDAPPVPFVVRRRHCRPHRFAVPGGTERLLRCVEVRTYPLDVVLPPPTP